MERACRRETLPEAAAEPFLTPGSDLSAELQLASPMGFVRVRAEALVECEIDFKQALCKSLHWWHLNFKNCSPVPILELLRVVACHSKVGVGQSWGQGWAC